jgi:hypothetical protein
MSAQSASPTAARIIASHGDLQLVYPENVKGIGAVIGKVDSPDLIAGVRVQPFSVFPTIADISWKCSVSATDWQPVFRPSAARYPPP